MQGGVELVDRLVDVKKDRAGMRRSESLQLELQMLDIADLGFKLIAFELVVCLAGLIQSGVEAFVRILRGGRSKCRGRLSSLGRRARARSIRRAVEIIASVQKLLVDPREFFAQAGS
jgi:ABC-type sugar transport system ATPase subunit